MNKTNNIVKEMEYALSLGNMDAHDYLVDKRRIQKWKRALEVAEQENERLRNTWIHLEHPCYGVDVFYDPEFEKAQGYMRLTELAALESEEA